MTAPATASTIHLRPSLRDLHDMPLDLDIVMQARQTLTPQQIGVWFALRAHLWCYGGLPGPIKQLAKVAGVGPRTFERMMPALAPMFDRDSEGRWRDLVLEDERGRRLDLTPDQQSSVYADMPARRPVSPAVSAARKQAGSAGGKKRWDHERRLQLVSDQTEASNLATSPLPSETVEAVARAMANAGVTPASGLANGTDAGMADVVDLPFGFATGLLSVLAGSASAPHSPSDRLLLNLQEESDQRTERAPEATDSKTDGKIAHAATASDGKTDTLSHGKTDDTAEGTKPAADSKTAVSGAARTALAAPDDARIIAVLRAAGGAKIPNALLTPAAIAPIRDLLEGGCDLERDIAATMRATLPGLNEPLRSLRASFIRQGAEASRDAARKTSAGADRVASTPQVFVPKDVPAYRAWLEHRKVRSFNSVQNQHGVFGWYFPSEWPPGVDARLYDPALAAAARQG